MIARFTSLALVAALFATGATAPAFAQAPRTRAVHTGDLDLSTEAGVAQLNSRIRRASVQVCGGYAHRDLFEAKRVDRCRKESIARTTSSVERLVMNARSGQRQAMLSTMDVESAR
ncbi:UrcA family protein [Sphingomonas zeicaulis]|uniref:UrcA family protein n=1 Tax=Sphingomonas zeicaulis TaxID=1632740 RepID=UPI003D1DCDC3